MNLIRLAAGYTCECGCGMVEVREGRSLMKLEQRAVTVFLLLQFFFYLIPHE